MPSAFKREFLRVNCDEPRIVKLGRDLAGKPARSDYGPQYSLIVNDGRSTLFLDAPHLEVLRRRGIQPGETVELTKTIQGNVPIYDARVVGAPQPAAQAHGIRMVAPASAYNQASGYANGHTNGHNGNSTGNGYPNGRGASGPPPSTQNGTPPPDESNPLIPYLRLSIEAFQWAQEYARDRYPGFTLTEDVRALAITLYIQDAKRAAAQEGLRI